MFVVGLSSTTQTCDDGAECPEKAVPVATDCVGSFWPLVSPEHLAARTTAHRRLLHKTDAQLSAHLSLPLSIGRLQLVLVGGPHTLTPAVHGQDFWFWALHLSWCH